MAVNAVSMGYLAGLFGGSISAPTSGGTGVSVVDRTPTAPWVGQAKTEPSALVRTALGGARFIDLRAPVLDAKGAAEDYRRLFAMHQGLTMLDAVAQRADAKSPSSHEAARLERTFQSGVLQINDFLGDDPFESIRIARSAAGSSAKTTAGPLRATNTYVTQALHKADLSGPVEAFQGDVRFTASIARLAGNVTVEFDLNEMGSTDRTMSQVVAYLNGKLAAAGVDTRFATEVIAGTPRTLKVGDRTLTLPSDSDSYALALKSIATETVSFAAADRSDAVYVAQVGGKDGGLALAKYQSDTGHIGAGAPPVPEGTENQPVQDRAGLSALSKGLVEVRAARTGTDGSIYMLGEANATIDGQTIKGARDVVLQKYDSAGKLVFTRTLGAVGEATAADLAIASDGRIAVVGSVTGALDAGKAGPDAAKPDSFVTVFDAEGGELWTQRRGARAEDEATSVAFAADGSVFVGGRTRSGMPGQAPMGGWDGYLQRFDPAGLYLGVEQFGSGGTDAASRMAVEGTTLVVAATENGRAILRRYDITDPQAPVMTATRDLGALQGDISSVALDGGRVILTGTTANASLGEGVAGGAHSGGRDAFVLRLSAGLAVDAADRMTFLGGSGDDTGVSASILDGKVWLVGQTGIVGEGSTATATGNLVRIDADTGTVEWHRELHGDAGRMRPMAITAAAGGASVLDRIGLPQGTLDFQQSQKLVDATSVRAGDQFMLDLGGGRMRTVTIAADETYESLARKISVASQNRLDVKVLPTDGVQGLRITLKSNRAPVEIVSGSLGRDALEALGLSQTLVHPSDGLADDRTVFALRMPGDLTLNTKAGIKASRDAIQAAKLQLMAAYRKLTQLDNPNAAALANVTYSEYQSKQIANYQAALLKLGGG